MGRQAKHSVSIGPNQRIGFSLNQRTNSPYYYVRFRSSDGKYPELSTGETTAKDALEVAEGLVQRSYCVLEAIVPWDEAITHMQNRAVVLGRRPKTLNGYLGTLSQFREFLTQNYPQVSGPGQVTPEMAVSFRDNYATGKFKRGKNGQEKSRTLESLDTTLGTLRAIFGQWFQVQLKIISANPFAEVEGPKLDKKEIVVPTDEEVQHFFDWLNTRFNNWRLPLLFFNVKEFCGNRLRDLCCAKSDQLINGALFFPASTVKGRKDRLVPLPPQMYDELKKMAGPTFLWESWGTDLKPILKAKGWPSHRLIDGFNVERFYQWQEGLTFRYREETGKTIKTHGFRKRAFTKAHEMGIPDTHAASFFGCGVPTARRNYIRLDEQAIMKEVSQKLILRNAECGTIPTEIRETPQKESPMAQEGDL